MGLFETYKDPRVNNNFRKARILAKISIVIVIIGLVIDSTFFIMLFFQEKIVGIDSFLTLLACICMYCFIQLYIPIKVLSLTTDACEEAKGKISLKTNPNFHNDDKSYIHILILLSFIPLPISLGIFFIFHVTLPLFNIIFLFIADIFLFKNLKIIKRLWKENPPEFMIREREREKKEEEQELKDKELAEYIKKKLVYKKLIEKCGTRFFIKYYKQILRLPLRDIEITENYSSEERDERLISAKTIIDKGLAEFAFTQIIDTYADVLSEDEIEQAKTLLAEIKE